MNEISKKWLDALKQFTVNPDAKINCLECNKGFLVLKDVPFTSDNRNYIDRYLICDTCGRREVATISID